MQLLIFLMGKFKVPMLGYVKPKLLDINDASVRVKIRLCRRTKNHLNSMYFGALAVGADLAGGAHAFYFAKKEGVKISFAFKDFHSEFIKRAETDVIFVMNEGALIEDALKISRREKIRVNQLVTVVAKNTNDENVAVFKLTASIKCS